MRNVPTVPVGIPDQKLITLLTRLCANLTSVVDCELYSFTVPWTAPYDLLIPTRDGRLRQGPPSIVRCGRAVLVSDPETVVSWGCTTWTWKGADTVRILNQDGLVAGVKYQLTYEVLG